MGTNYYMLTQNKQLAQKATNGVYELTDSPYFAYKIHIAKTSCGWLPLFQGYKNGIQSVRDIMEFYETGEFKIYDEYGRLYKWDEFTERVLEFNGGKLGVKPKEKIEPMTGEMAEHNDVGMPEYSPVSHVSGTDQSYKYVFGHLTEFGTNIFKDNEGYEFDYTRFD